MKTVLGLLVLTVNISAAQVVTELPSAPSEFNTVGIDQFGRSFGPISGTKPQKQVGIFFWPWIGQPYASGIYDATVIGAMPDGLKLLYDFDHYNKDISPTGQAHFWGEPLWGYYNSDDEWVIRRQIKLLTIAGVDFIAFDLTNRVTYRKVYEKVLRVIEEFIDAGLTPPLATFYTHSRSFATTWQLYTDLYKPGLYSRAWYRVNGKPMIIAYTNEDDDINEAFSRKDSAYRPVPYTREIREFFYFKKPQWPSDPFFEDGLPWVEWTFPQPNHKGNMSVSVASHPKVPMSRSLTSGWINWGRGWDPVAQINKKEDVDKGTFFQKQWDHAIVTDVDTVFVGGWNEWIAYKQPWGDEYMLCDAADREYSRDIEPMRGGYNDAFYIQLITNIRKFKGINHSTPAYSGRKMTADRISENWAEVGAVFRNQGNTHVHRHSHGASQAVFYSLPAPANCLSEVRVAHDDLNFYFLVKADLPFVQREGESPLQILLGTGAPTLKGWEGYEFLIEMDLLSATASVSRLSEGRKKIQVATSLVVENGNLVQVTVPRKPLEAGENIDQIYFKVADGVLNPNDIMDYYVTGSSMPMGRLSFLYKLKN